MIASLILGLHLLGFIPMENAAVFLFIYGGLLVLAEFFLPSGLAAFNGVLSLIAGFALYAGPESVLGLYVGWGVFFGIAFAEFFVLGACIFLLLRYRRQKITTGAESMIGQEAAVLEWNGKKAACAFRARHGRRKAMTRSTCQPKRKSPSAPFGI